MNIIYNKWCNKMSILNLLRGLNVEVDPVSNKVTITGLRFLYVCRDLEKYIGAKMLYSILDNVSYSRLVFSMFYLPDFYHAINTLLTDPKFKRRIRSGRELLAIRTELEKIPLIANIKIINSTDPSAIPKIDKSKLNKIFNNIKLFDYQDKFIDDCIWKSKLLGLNGYLLDAPPGSGKSISSISLMEILDIDTIFVVSPKKAVNDVWDETITRIYKEPQSYSMSLPVLHGPSKPAGFDIDDRFIVCHYESLGKLNDYLKSIKIPNKRYGVILDESHSLNSHNSERSIQFRELVSKIDPIFCLWMSGTPIKALGTETMTMFATIDRLFDKNVYKSFLKVFGISGVYAISVMAHRLQLVRSEIKTNGSGVEQYTHKVKVTLQNGADYTLKTISNKMIDYVKERKEYYQKNAKKYEDDFFSSIEVYRSCVVKGRGDTSFFRADLEDYLSKAKTLHNGYSPTDPKHKQYVLECNYYEDKVIIPRLPNDVKKIFRKAKSVYKYVELTIMGEALGNILGKARSRCNADMVKQLVTDAKVISEDGEIYQSNLPDLILNAQAKTIIFTDYVEVVKETEYQLKLKGFKPISIFGETTSGNGLALQTKIFKEDSEINPLITTYKTLSEAVPLTEANRVIFLNLPFRSGTYEQAVKRANRIGQTLDVDLFEVTLDTGEEPNISTRNEDILKWSEEQVALILGKKLPEENKEILHGLIESSTVEDKVKTGINTITKVASKFLDW
jgi:SNF2 family DNA or RNA helicase|nr:MAG TPA: Chromatin remodeling complex ATPase [Caudoviricetes sp.]